MAASLTLQFGLFTEMPFVMVFPHLLFWVRVCLASGFASALPCVWRACACCRLALAQTVLVLVLIGVVARVQVMISLALVVAVLGSYVPARAFLRKSISNVLRRN